MRLSRSRALSVKDRHLVEALESAPVDRSLSGSPVLASAAHGADSVTSGNGPSQARAAWRVAQGQRRAVLSGDSTRISTGAYRK
jgi:hypothetical protein